MTDQTPLNTHGLVTSDKRLSMGKIESMTEREPVETEPPANCDHRAPADDAERPTRRHANWAIAAVIIAMLSLFFDRLAPLLGLVATLFALLGLRQIRRNPLRYQGRGFCWVAIALALIVAGLSLMVEPAPGPESESRVSQTHSNVVPGSENGWATS